MTEHEYLVQPIPLDDILADDQFNCRGKITPMDVVDLVKDIELNGLIAPVVVCPLTQAQILSSGKKWRLLAGFRRYTAHRVMGRAMIPASVRPTALTEIDARFLNLSENFKRQNLDIIQEAKALQAFKDLGVPETAMAARLGQSRGWVQIRYMLLGLPLDIQAEVKAGIIKQTNIRELSMIAKTGNKDALYHAVRVIKKQKETGEKNVSVAHLTLGKEAKRIRNKKEMDFLMDYLTKAFKPSLHTRVLAWCGGEITNQELYESMAKYAAEKGLFYEIPVHDPWSMEAFREPVELGGL